MTELAELRRTNGRRVIEKFGGVGKVAARMGYSNPSFLVQIYGPNPSRKPSEHTTRKMEQALNLPVGSLDEERASGEVSPELTTLVADMIRLVGDTLEKEGVAVPPGRFASVVAMAYADAVEHGGVGRENHITGLVRLQGLHQSWCGNH